MNNPGDRRRSGTHLKSVIHGLHDNLFRQVLRNVESQLQRLAIVGVLNKR